MPKAWSEREKELVREALKKEGKKLFEKYGLQKTTVEEIVGAARISKGAFYLFYRSKEELYFDILESVEIEFREKLFGNVFQPGTPRRESFKRFLRNLIEMIVSTPLYSHLDSSDYEYLLRKLPEAVVQKHVRRDQEDTSRHFRDWMEQGWIRRVDLQALSGLLFFLFYFVLHREDFPEANFEKAKELWIDMFSTYMLPGGGKKDD